MSLSKFRFFDFSGNSVGQQLTAITTADSTAVIIGFFLFFFTRNTLMVHYATFITGV